MAKNKSKGLLMEELSFIEEPPRKVDCPICLQVMLDDPHLVSCCGHRWCKSCIEKVKNDNKPCPLCNEKEFEIFPDKDLLKIINGLQVNCTNKECQWKGELKSLQVHLNRGKRKGDCQFEKLECKCQEKPYRKDIESHERRKCNQRNILCPYCQCILGTHEWITQEHYLQCTQYLIPCPNKCQNDKGFSRGNIEDHVSKECPLQPVECEFKWAGCHESPLRKDLPQHNIDSQLNHISLIAKACGELKKEIETLKDNNNNMKQKLEGVHHAVVGNDYPILPVMVKLSHETKFSANTTFYTETCGRHMSLNVTQDLNTFVLKFRVCKGKFDHLHQAKVTEIEYKYVNETHTVTNDCYDSKLDAAGSYRQEFVKIHEGPPMDDTLYIIILSVK